METTHFRLNTNLYSKEAFLALKGIQDIARDAVCFKHGSPLEDLNEFADYHTDIEREKDNETIIHVESYKDADELHHFVTSEFKHIIKGVFRRSKDIGDKVAAYWFYYKKDKDTSAAKKIKNRFLIGSYVLSFTLTFAEEVNDDIRTMIMDQADREKLKANITNPHAYDADEYWTPIRIECKYCRSKEKYVDVHLGFISCLIDHIAGVNDNELIEKHGEKTVKMLVGTPADPFTAEIMDNRKDEWIKATQSKIEHFLSEMEKMIHKEGAALKRIHDDTEQKAKARIEEFKAEYDKIMREFADVRTEFGDVDGIATKWQLDNVVNAFETEMNPVADQIKRISRIRLDRPIV